MALKKIPDSPKKNLKYTKGGREVFSVRIPKQLITAIKEAANKSGWSKSDFTQFALDQYLQEISKTRK